MNTSFQAVRGMARMFHRMALESIMAPRTETRRRRTGTAEVRRGEIHAAVLAAFEARGPMTAAHAEKLPEFERYGFSTIRKRISELFQSGELVSLPQRKKNEAMVYAIAAKPELIN